MAAKETGAPRAGAAGVRVERVYEQPTPEQGTRVLVDRIWPRGLAKEAAQLDLWCKDVAPSTELRKWYSHDPAKFDRFVERYRAELRSPVAAAAYQKLQHLAAHGTVTLLTASKAVDISQAAVLAGELNHRLS